MFLKGQKMLVLWCWKGHVIWRALIVACLKSREAYTCLYLLVSNFSWTEAVKLRNLIFNFCIFEKQIFTIRVQLHCLKKRQHYSTGHFLVLGLQEGTQSLNVKTCLLVKLRSTNYILNPKFKSLCTNPELYGNQSHEKVFQHRRICVIEAVCAVLGLDGVVAVVASMW